MQLLADRFVASRDGTVLDLATGHRVDFTIAPVRSEIEGRRWALRCDARQKLHHPALPPLIDYGPFGRAERFEARQPDRRRAVRRAPALATIERPAATALAELFERPDAVRPRIAALWGPDGSGKDTVVLALARTARLHGFVPVSAAVALRFADVLCGRTLFVIDRGDQGDGWRVLLSAAGGAFRPHVLLFVGTEEPSGVDGVGLAPLPVEALVAAVRPGAGEGPRGEAIRRLAAQAGGWPGRFARLLWGSVPAAPAFSPAFSSDRRASPGGLRRPPTRAAEQPAVYAPDAAAPGAPTPAPWPEPDDLAMLRQQVRAAEQLIANGQHARGERLLRQAAGSLARRRDWSGACGGNLALAVLLSRRGRARDAQAVLESAAEYARQASDERRLIEIATLDGMAAIDLGRLDAAETRLAAAVAAARARADAERLGRAAAALARALFWQGRYEVADDALRGGERLRLSDAAAIEGLGLRSAIAVGLRRFDEAIGAAAEAASRAGRLGDMRLVADAARRAAFVHLAAGDGAAVERELALAVRAARGGREPLLAARARLLAAEHLRRSGRHAAASRVLRHILRLGASALPPLVRAHAALLRDLLASDDQPAEIAARHAAATGIGALALFVPITPRGGSASVADRFVDDIVAILDVCQTCGEETAVMAEVCRRVRARLHAAAAGVAVAGAGAAHVIVAQGGRVDAAIAERAMAAGAAIGPHRSGDRLEAAAPIQYGGSIIGALVVRWTIGTLHDPTPAAQLLTPAAAALAPIVSAAVARVVRTAPSKLELIGASQALADVRAAVERAAPTPFPVLIEGESGSGKELVARAIHRASHRRDRLFRAVNCAALPDDLIEAELFGHARGAFTGAVAERIGVFEEAHGGTLLLDEVGELSPRAQAKLLRVIQEGELRRIGENVARRIDVRIVAATNRDLRAEASAGRFRLDLLYRLDVVRIAVPPLRERREDIPVLAEHFWREAAARVGSRAVLSAAALAALARYDWPGNVRELQNVMASLAVRCPRRGVVAPAALGPQFMDGALAEASRLDVARRVFEERFVRAALARTGGHKARAAEELGITRQGLAKLMVRLGITDARPARRA